MRIGHAYVLAPFLTITPSVRDRPSMVQEIMTGGWFSSDRTFLEGSGGSPNGVRETINEEGHVNARASLERIDGWH